jgi:purine/pyrimidine-nucleoside phosphorylase
MLARDLESRAKGELHMGENTNCQFDNVSVVCKANIYFDGKVVSHGIEFADGSKKTVGLIYPGAYTFNTGAPERMEIIAGSCRAKLAGESAWTTYAAGSAFDVSGESSFEIAVDECIAEYVCSFGGS